MSGHWKRVARRRPCPVCEKPDWCLYTGDDYGPTAAICARVESEKQAGEAGWLHLLRPDDATCPVWRRTIRTAVVPMAPPPANQASLERMATAAAEGTSPELLERFAGSLGLSVDSLGRLSVGWLSGRRAWSFPMRTGAGEVLGIRLRHPDGRKLAVRGGKEGLFVPTDLQSGGRLLICEGPTDTAALLDLGFCAIGRPSCSGGLKHLIALVKLLTPSDVVIVADRDGPGMRGAGSLASVLVAYVHALRMIVPPAKDARQWKCSGATKADVEAAIKASRPEDLKIRVLSNQQDGVFAAQTY